MCGRHTRLRPVTATPARLTARVHAEARGWWPEPSVVALGGGGRGGRSGHVWGTPEGTPTHVRSAAHGLEVDSHQLAATLALTWVGVPSGVPLPRAHAAQLARSFQNVRSGSRPRRPRDSARGPSSLGRAEAHTLRPRRLCCEQHAVCPLATPAWGRGTTGRTGGRARRARGALQTVDDRKLWSKGRQRPLSLHTPGTGTASAP